MSRKVEVEAHCVNCECDFKASLFRSIWGEQPENREIVFNDTINVVVCPHCQTRIRVPFSLLYEDVDRQFAVWYEPEPDPTIDKDTRMYAAMFGPDCFYVTAPRVFDWEGFKRAILRFGGGELRASRGRADMTRNLTGPRTTTASETGLVKDCVSCGRSVRTIYGDLTSGNLICANCWEAFCEMLAAEAYGTGPETGGPEFMAAWRATAAVRAWQLVAKAEAAGAYPHVAAEAVSKALEANAAVRESARCRPNRSTDSPRIWWWWWRRWFK
jgi:hypothetical protein